MFYFNTNHDLVRPTEGQERRKGNVNKWSKWARMYNVCPFLWCDQPLLQIIQLQIKQGGVEVEVEGGVTQKSEDELDDTVRDRGRDWITIETGQTGEGSGRQRWKLKWSNCQGHRSPVYSYISLWSQDFIEPEQQNCWCTAVRW